MIQNNKALKRVNAAVPLFICLRVIQNNKALKPLAFSASSLTRLRVIQNNKALKPQIRLKAARRRAVSCILTIL